MRVELAVWLRFVNSFIKNVPHYYIKNVCCKKYSKHDLFPQIEQKLF